MMKPKTIAGRAWGSLLCAMLLAASAWTNEANAETYVILSLIGDHLTLVGMGGQLGSHLDQNPHQTVPVNGTGFDDFAVRAADASIAKAPDPLIVGSGPAFFATE